MMSIFGNSKKNANDDETENHKETTIVTRNAYYDAEPLNILNTLNVFAFTANVLITGLIGAVGVGDLPTTTALVTKYQTLVTPTDWAFSIWAVIFISQAIFTVAQCLPRFRSLPMVQSGVGHWYIFTCLFQILWNFAFSFELIAVSLVFMLLAALSLVGLVTSQYYAESEKNLLEYWVLKFPFAVHCGWLLAIYTVNANVSVVSRNDSESVQITMATASLAVLLALSTFIIFVPNRPNFTIPAALAWATGGIAAELSNPKSSITDLFVEYVISGTKNLAATISIIILVQIVGRMIVDLGKKIIQRRASGGDAWGFKSKNKNEQYTEEKV